MVKYREAKLDRAFSALSHPIRRGIVARLAGGSATVAELAKPHHVSAPAISKHLHILEEAGLMRREKDGRVHHCRLVPDRVGEAQAWIEKYRVFWEESFDRLENYLKETQVKEKKHGRKK